MTVAVARVGTRGSALALAQTALVVERLAALGIEVELVTVQTSGDRAQSDGSMMLERGAFVKDLEAALLAGEIDLAIHSAKDMPGDVPPGTVLAAFPIRGDARDALVTADGSRLEQLPSGSRVGTESPRRRAFIRYERPDLEVVPIRGNVDTRLAKLDAGEVDALVLAAAGLERLGLAGRIAEALPVARMVPAPGQGALAVQAREGDPWAERAREIDDWGTRLEVVAERAFLRAMGGGCRTPFAAHASWFSGELAMDAAALAVEGEEILRDRLIGPDEEAAALGERLARRLIDRGAERPASASGP
ncbi:MAG TPA: hydroxymethylbilane synthase [Gemmatimonadota bacterium]|nr:hydroxymethylbilane synthase [Gemmatimonadota bacterium]